MDARQIRLPDGKIGLFDVDATDEDIRNTIETQYPGTYTSPEPTPEPTPEPQLPPEQREGVPFFREFMPGVSSAFTQMGAIPEGFTLQRDAVLLSQSKPLLDVYERIEAGERFDYATAAEIAKNITTATPETILLYQDSSDAKRSEIKGRLETDRTLRTDSVTENLKELQRVQEDSALGAPNVANFSEIRSAADFGDYIGYMLGSGASQYLPTLTAGVAGGLMFGPPGAVIGGVSASTIQSLPQQVQQRLSHILQVTENMTSEEERADAIIEYLTKTANTSALVALAQGGLDAFGVTKVLGSIFKKKLSGEFGEKVIEESETVRQAAMRAASQTPRALGEEAVTGALQQVADMAGQYSLGERTGDVFTGDNLIEVIDAGVAEAVGGISAQGINIATAAGAQKLRNDREAQIKRRIQESEDLDEQDTAALLDRLKELTQEEIDNDPGITEDEATRRAGRVLANEEKAKKEPLEEIGVDTSTEETTVDPVEATTKKAVAKKKEAAATTTDTTTTDTDTTTQALPKEVKPKPKSAYEAKLRSELKGKSTADIREKLLGFDKVEKSWEKRARRGGKGSKAYATYQNLRTQWGIVNDLLREAEQADKARKPAIEKEMARLQAANPKMSGFEAKQLATEKVKKEEVASAVEPSVEPSVEPTVETKPIKKNSAFAKASAKFLRDSKTEIAPRTQQAILQRAKELKEQQELAREQAAIAGPQDPTMDPSNIDADVDAILAATDDVVLNRTDADIIREAENQVIDELNAEGIDPYISQEQNIDNIDVTDEEVIGVQNAQADPTGATQGQAIKDGTQTEIYEATANTKYDPFASPVERITEKEKDGEFKPGSKKSITSEVNNLYDEKAKIAEEAGDGRPVRALDILDAISNVKSSSKQFEAAVAQRLAKFKPFLEGVKVRFADPSDMDNRAGSYTETTDGERIITLTRSNDVNDGRNNETFLHEALHAATARIIAQYKQDPNKLPVPQRQAIAQLQNLMANIKDRIEKKKTKGALTDAEIFFNNVGAFSDVGEFVSYGLSNPAMQELLQSTPATNKKYPGALSQFVKLVRQIFNLGKGVNTAFDELIIISDKVLQPKAFAASAPVDVELSAKKMSGTEVTARKKLNASTEPRQFLDAMGDLFKFKKLSTAIDWMIAKKDSINVPTLKAALYTLPTQTIIDLGNRIYQLKGLKRIQTAVRRVSGDRTRRMQKLAAKAEIYGKFIRKFGADINRALSDSMHLSTLYNIDGSKLKTEEQALKLDSKLQELRQRKVDQSLTASQRQAAQAAETKRKTEIKIFFKGTKADDDYPLGFIGWEKLNKDTQGEANKIYVMVKDTYKENFLEYYASLQEKIQRSESIGDEGKANILAEIQSEMLEQINNGVYFPLVRFGDYYVGVGKGVNRRFEMFESATERNTRIRELAREYKELNNDPRTVTEIANSEMFGELGDQPRSLRQELEKGGGNDAGEVLRNIFSTLDRNTTIDPTTNKKGFADVNLIKNEIYQLYLNTLPEQSMRKRFTKRKGTAGFSGDAFRIFLSTNHQSANQLSKVKHDDALRGAIASAYDELQGRGGTNLLRARAYVDRLVTRALDDTRGDPLEGKLMERIVRFGNQAAFFYYLTSAKSAMVQLTQLPIVGLPILAAKYGSAKAFGMMKNMMPVWNTMLARQVDQDGNVVGFKAQMPSLKQSRYVLELPDDLKMFAFEAIDAADALDMFNATYATETSQRSRVPTQGYHSKLGQSTRLMGNVMSGLFHHAERSSRQIMFMSSYRLAMERQMQGYERELAKLMDANQDMTREQAVEALYAPYMAKTKEINALMKENKFLVDSGRYTKEDAASELLGKDKKILGPRQAARRALLNAVDDSYEALFDYGQFNKAEILKGRGNMAFLRIPAQFLTFPINMTVFMARNFYGMIPFIKNNGQKREAAIKFFGAQGMAFLFSGVTGLWQYSTLMGLLEGMREMFRPEGEEEDQWYDEDDDGNPLGKRNLDLWFREWFIPTHFGPDSSLAETFGLSEEQAQLLQRAVKLGPISAYSGVNVGASTSLDGLFWTKGKGIEDIEDIEQAMLEKLYGPAGSLAGDMYNGINLIAEGKFLDGAEKLTPAFFKGAVKSIKYQEEGLRTGKDIELKSAEYYTAGKLLGTTLGFSDTEVSEIREALFEAKNLTEKILNERTKVLSEFDAVYNDYLRDSTNFNEERVNEAWAEIVDYNQRNGQAGFGITNGQLNKSLKGRAKSRFLAEQSGGLMLGSPKSYAAILPLLSTSGVIVDRK